MANSPPATAAHQAFPCHPLPPAKTNRLNYTGWVRRALQLLLLFLLTAPPAVGLAPAQNAVSDQAGPAQLPEPPNALSLLDPAVRFELEEALQRKDYEKAEVLLAREIETNPRAPRFELLVYLGGLFFVDGKYLNSAIAFKKADALEALDPGNRFTLAMSYILLGRRDWARPELETLAHQDPANPLYLYWLARSDYDDNNYQPAVQKLELLLGRHPDYLRAWDRLGLCYEALGRNEEAIEHYRRALTLSHQQNSRWPWPALNLGSLLIQLGRFEEAEQYLRHAVEMDPAFAQSRYKLGLALEKLERWDASAEELQQAARLDPAYPDPHWALGRVLRRSGDREGAAAAVARYKELKDAQSKQ